MASQLADVAVVFTSHAVKIREQVRLRTGLRRRTHRPPRRVKTGARTNVVERCYLHVSEQRNDFQLLQYHVTHAQDIRNVFPENSVIAAVVFIRYIAKPTQGAPVTNTENLFRK